MKRFSIVVLLVCFFLPSFSQMNEKDTSFKTYKVLENISYEIFSKSKPKEFKKIQNLDEADNSTLAGYLNSVCWENTLEWYAYNRGKDVKEVKYDSSYLDSKKNIPNDAGWWGPNMAIYYTQEGRQLCFLKFYVHLHQTNKTYSISSNLIFENGKWIQGVRNGNGILGLIEILNPQTLAALLEGKPIQDSLLNSLINQTRNKFGGLDQIKLKKAHDSWIRNSAEWLAFIEPYSIADLEPVNTDPTPPIFKKGTGLPITQFKSFAGGCTSSLGSDTLKPENIEYRQLYNFLKKCYEAKTPDEIRKLYLTNDAISLPPIFREASLENLRFINGFSTSLFESPLARYYQLVRLKDITTGKEYILKLAYKYAPEKNPDKPQFKDGSFYFGSNEAFQDLDWLFENLNPEVFHHSITYKMNEKYQYPYPEHAAELDRCVVDFQDAFNSLSIEGVYMYFLKLKEDNSCSYCFK
jgi:hypothetical protein